MSIDQPARQWADSIIIEERNLPGLSAGQAGIVYYTPSNDGATFFAVRTTGLSPDRAATFDAWARRRAYVVASSGDLQIDGWLKRSIEESWHITAQAVDIPEIRFLGE